MNLQRPTRTTLILSLCMAALACALAYENQQLSLLANNLETTADKDTLDALLARLTKVDERLDAVDGKHLATNDDFRSGQQALSNRIDAVQALAKQATEPTQGLSQSITAAEEQVMVLKASVEMIDIRLQELSKPLVTEPPVVAPPPKPVIRKKPPPAPQPPPFTVIGIEYRGGERFLSVAPPGSTQLSQINLIRPGDGVTGTAWKLKSMDGQLAHYARTASPQQIVNFDLRYETDRIMIKLQDYGLAELYTVLTFCVRIVILTMTIPLFLLAGFTGLVDGLVRRDLRKFGSGRESSYLYHKPRGTIIPLMIVPWTVYLALPISVSPLLILGPCAVLMGGVTVYVTVSSFKKYF